MPVYQIDYDLAQPGQKYDQLYDAIRRLGETHHDTESTFFVKTDLDPKEIRKRLKDALDSTDSLIVVKIGDSKRPRWATSNAGGAGDWLKEHL